MCGLGLAGRSRHVLSCSGVCLRFWQVTPRPGTTNETLLNGAPVTGPQPLHEGEVRLDGARLNGLSPDRVYCLGKPFQRQQLLLGLRGFLFGRFRSP